MRKRRLKANSNRVCRTISRLVKCPVNSRQNKPIVGLWWKKKNDCVGWTNSNSSKTKMRVMREKNRQQQSKNFTFIPHITKPYMRQQQCALRCRRKKKTSHMKLRNPRRNFVPKSAFPRLRNLTDYLIRAHLLTAPQSAPKASGSRNVG